MRLPMTKKEIKAIFGELTKNIGLGIFVNGVYGLSDGSIEIYNLIDIGMGIFLMLLGIILERKAQ